MKISDIESEEYSERLRYRRVMFLQELVAAPSLLTCGTVPYDKMVVYHDGERLICEMEAIGPSTDIV